MEVPRARFTIRTLMVMVTIVALSMFFYEACRRSHAIPLDRNSGRFLVFVKTFRGPAARSQADALALELRYRHGLPAYVFDLNEWNRVHPRSKRRKGSPGPGRMDSVAVLIGDCENSAETDVKLRQVKNLESKSNTSLAGRLKPLRTVNPYLPAGVGSNRRTR